MKTIERDWDVIVIGSGLGGLSAAARLTRAGLRVLVLEQHVFAGGYAHHFLRKVKGTDVVYDFDVALHQTGDLSPGRSMHEILKTLGILDRIKLNRFDIAYRTCGPSHDLTVPAKADDYEALLAQHYPEHARGIHDLFAMLARADGGMDVSPDSAALMGTTLEEMVRSYVDDERVAAIFSTLWGYLGMVPSKLCAFTYVMMWNSFHHGGCFYVRNGGQALSDAFVSLIAENGGRVLLKTPVSEIITEAGRVVGVETETRGRFNAPVVVSNASAPLTFERLLDHPDIADLDRQHDATLPVACSIDQAYVGIRGSASKLGLRDRGLFNIPSYDFDAEWEALERGDYRSQGWMLGNHNLADPGHAPLGRSILHAAVMARGDLWTELSEAEYIEHKRELEGYLVDRLAEVIPDVRERIEVCETGTPHTMQRYSWNPGGSIYGWAITPESHSVLRSQPRTSVPGLYLAGAWTFPAPGFQGAMTSGHHTAGLIFEDIEGRKPHAVGDVG
jgi:prolycopene isomerase